MNTTENRVSLFRLARMYGIQTAYYGMEHTRHAATSDALLAMLRALGAPVESPRDIPDAARGELERRSRRILPPVIVAWEGNPAPPKVILPAALAESRLEYTVILETGEVKRGVWDFAAYAPSGRMMVNGEGYTVKQPAIEGGLPYGYHTFSLAVPGGKRESRIISAPLQAQQPGGGKEERGWGVFLPLYALQTADSWGMGTYRDLEEMVRWTAELHGNLVGTLPLLPTCNTDHAGVSPYMPASRVMWNELFIDVPSIEGFGSCVSAGEMVAAGDFRNELRRARAGALVDYRAQADMKRRVLTEMERCLCGESGPEKVRLERFLTAHPEVDDYARFRALCDRYGSSWSAWPGEARKGRPSPSDFDEADRRYHAFAQWAARLQMDALGRTAADRNVRVYLDFPVGVHPESFDLWRERDSFLPGAAVGAPPDPAFTQGQNWGFPPPHPEKIRENGYRYLIACLRHHMQFGGVLRIDHVMGLHRLFCIPGGVPNDSGVYLKYNPEEMYAVMTLESYRSGTVIVGEDLGTVPPYVRPAMNRHGFKRMHVAQYEFRYDSDSVLKTAPGNTVASLNTHDMFPFTAYLEGKELARYRELGWIGRDEMEAGTKRLGVLRKSLIGLLGGKHLLEPGGDDSAALVRGCYGFLASGRSWMTLVNLEDLWGETEPQNIPSTLEEHPNWRRKARYSFEEFSKMSGVTGTLSMVDKLRRKKGKRK